MEITSFYFLIFYTVVLLLYYLVPKKAQWVLLAAANLAFYWLAGTKWLILYPLCGIAVTYLATWVMDRAAARNAEQAGVQNGKQEGTQNDRHAGFIRTLALLVDLTALFGVLIFLKYRNFGTGNAAAMENTAVSGFAVPLGLSFYTFTLVGYAVDVYTGIAERQTNFAKLVTYGMFFPVMVSGPIVSYRESGAQFTEPHRFDWDRVTRGMQRMLWGFFKKLVIAERAAVPANLIFNNYASYPGAYIWAGAVLFTIQLYCDFSGCMDIVIGIGETLGLVIPENFTQPFFSKSIAEYWRRWHITLGVWMRNYVFYPLLRTRFFTWLSKWSRKKLGRKGGKQLTTFSAMFILWLTVGLWHGGDVKYVIGSGLLHWAYIVIGELTLPFFQKIFPARWFGGKDADGTPRKAAKGADLFRIVRTFFLVNIGNVFFRAASAKDAVRMLQEGFAKWNPGVLFSTAAPEIAEAAEGAGVAAHTITGSVGTAAGGVMPGLWGGLGLDWPDMGVLVIAVGILFAVSLLEVLPDRKTGTARALRDRIAEKPLPVRWVIWFVLLFAVIIFGEYGPGYDSAAFIYQGF